MSWISEIKEMFVRTELEQKMYESKLQIDVGHHIAEKGADFKKAYAKISDDENTKAIVDRLLKKIQLVDNWYIKRGRNTSFFF